MEPELTSTELQRIFEQHATSVYADPAISQSLYDSWSATVTAMADHLQHKAKMSIAYFDYDERAYMLHTEAARLPEWFRPERFAKGDFINIYNPETGRTVVFDFVCKHIGPVHSRIVLQSTMPLRQYVTDGGSEFLRVLITY